MEIKNIREVLKDSTTMLKDALIDGILNQGLLKTGRLANSVRVSYVDDDVEPNFQITMENYGIYQDSGVNGTRSGFSPNPESFYSPGKFKSSVIGGPLPFLVRKSIAEKGFRPRPFIIPSVTRLLNNLEPELTNAGAEDIDSEIRELFKTNGAIN